MHISPFALFWTILAATLAPHATPSAHAGESAASIATYRRSSSAADPLVTIQGAVACKLFAQLESGEGHTQEKLEVTNVDAGAGTTCTRTVSRLGTGESSTHYLCRKDLALDNSPAAEKLFRQHSGDVLSELVSYNGANLRCSRETAGPAARSRSSPVHECAFHAFADGTTEGDAVVAGP
jgi:hypothetical protein